MGKQKTEAEMAAILKIADRRSTSIDVFCSEHGISTGVYYYWRNRLRNKEQDHSFLPIRVQTSTSWEEQVGSGCCILRGDLEIRFDQLPPVDYLRQLLGFDD